MLYQMSLPKMNWQPQCSLLVAYNVQVDLLVIHRKIQMKLIYAYDVESSNSHDIVPQVFLNVLWNILSDELSLDKDSLGLTTITKKKKKKRNTHTHLNTPK